MAKKPAAGSFGFSQGASSFGLFQYIDKGKDVRPGISFARVRGTVDEESSKIVTDAVAMLNKGTLKVEDFKTKTISPASLTDLMKTVKKSAKK